MSRRRGCSSRSSALKRHAGVVRKNGVASLLDQEGAMIGAARLSVPATDEVVLEESKKVGFVAVVPWDAVSLPPS